jgi:hypothetical protein
MSEDAKANSSDDDVAREYDEEIDFVERVDLDDSHRRQGQVVLEVTRGTLFFKDGKLVRHVTRKSTTTIEVASTNYRKADIW